MTEVQYTRPGPVTPGGFGSSSFTPGSVIIADSSGRLNEDNPGLFFDVPNNRLGIGTNVPTSTLQMQSTDQTMFQGFVTSNAFFPDLNMFRARAGGTAVQVADITGRVIMWGLDSAAATYVPGADLTAIVEGTVGVGRVPAYLRVRASQDAAGSPEVVVHEFHATGDRSIRAIEETVRTLAASGTAATIDLASGTVHDITLTGTPCVLTFAAPAAGVCSSFTLVLRQDGTGTRLATWPASVKWAAGTAPTLSTPASSKDILTFFTPDGGTTWYGALVGKAFA